MYIDWKSSIVFFFLYCILKYKKWDLCYSICISAFTEHIFGVYLYFCAKFWSSVAKISADDFFIRWSLWDAWGICTALCLSVIVWPSVHFRNQNGKDVFLVYSELGLRMQQCFLACSQCASLNYVFLRKRWYVLLNPKAMVFSMMLSQNVTNIEIYDEQKYLTQGLKYREM